MKKIILLLITLITLTNVSYASFPVTETEQIEVVETVEVPNYGESQPIWGILSLTFVLISFFLIPNVFLMLISSFLGIIFGAIGFNKKLKGLAITSFVLSLLICIITLTAIVVALVFGGVGAAFGG
jgi:hypothetical protein